MAVRNTSAEFAIAMGGFAGVAWAFPPSAGQKADIGYTDLATRLGVPPTGAGVSVTQVEGDNDGGTGIRYLPNEVDADIAPRLIDDRSGVSSPASARSTHATEVAYNFYGDQSLAPGISNIDLYEVNDWINTELAFG